MRADEGEFAEFVRGRGQALHRTAYLLTGDWALAEDLVQTSLARCWPAWGRIRHADPEGYVRKAMLNAHLSAWRRKWRGEVPTDLLPEGVAGDAAAGLHERPALFSALRRLPPRQRAVVVLRFYEDLSEAQTASLLGITPGTVKSTSSRALAALRADGALAGLAPTRSEA